MKTLSAHLPETTIDYLATESELRILFSVGKKIQDKFNVDFLWFLNLVSAW